jgi:predicted peptidase
MREPKVFFSPIFAFLWAALFLPVSHLLHSQEIAPEQRTFEWKSEKKVSHDYLVFLPSGYDAAGEKKWPMVVYLCGGGGNAKPVNRQFAPHRDRPFVFLAPICPLAEEGVPGHYTKWNPEIVGEIVKKVIAEHSIDEANCSLMGFSMGGSGAWELPFYHPELFSRVVVMSGSCHPWKLKHYPKIPVWVFSGSKEPWLPQHTNAVNSAKQFGLDVSHTIWPGAGRGAGRQRTMSDEALWEWLGSAP